VEKAFEAIHIAPDRWPLVDERHRRYLVHRFPFSVFYRFDDQEIIIVAVAHRRQRPNYWSRRR
jgi:plasmid stabilization system protein ParE